MDLPVLLGGRDPFLDIPGRSGHTKDLKVAVTPLLLGKYVVLAGDQKWPTVSIWGEAKPKKAMHG